jgi:hypothetical protein
MTVQQFPFEHDDRFALPLRAFGVSPSRAYVRVGESELEVRFGLFSVRTPLSNVRGAAETGPYLAHKAIGPRLSLADRGATFGTSAERGVCIRFHEPVRAMPPIRSPGLTVTVSDTWRLATLLNERAG